MSLYWFGREPLKIQWDREFEASLSRALKAIDTVPAPVTHLCSFSKGLGGHSSPYCAYNMASFLQEIIPCSCLHCSVAFGPPSFRYPERELYNCGERCEKVRKPENSTHSGNN
uniref:Uncharacterized protein n=1 Tax=Steinernema glaseri TaxID=37863 RepID=A0A1I7YKV0_9BILA